MATQAAHAEVWWLSVAGVVAGATVADIGCGPGAMSVELARLVGPSGRVIAVERDQTAPVKFTEAGGTVSVDASLEADGRLLLVIRDTGIGIAEDDMQRVSSHSRSSTAHWPGAFRVSASASMCRVHWWPAWAASYRCTVRQAWGHPWRFFYRQKG